LNKIQHIERQFRSAHDWTQATGAGVTDPVSFKEAVLRKCPWYYDLKDVMKDRASISLMATSEDLRFTDLEDEGEGNKSAEDELHCNNHTENRNTPTGVLVETTEQESVAPLGDPPELTGPRLTTPTVGASADGTLVTLRGPT